MHARHSRIEWSNFDCGFRHYNSTLHAMRCHRLNKTGREYNTTWACQCQRLPLESKLERERGISRGYADRLADRSIAVLRIAIAEDDGVASRYQ